MTKEEKEKIDYEIFARRKDREENLKGWAISIIASFVITLTLLLMIKCASS